MRTIRTRIAPSWSVLAVCCVLRWFCSAGMCAWLVRGGKLVQIVGSPRRRGHARRLGQQIARATRATWSGKHTAHSSNGSHAVAPKCARVSVFALVSVCVSVGLEAAKSRHPLDERRSAWQSRGTRLRPRASTAGRRRNEHRRARGRLPRHPSQRDGDVRAHTHRIVLVPRLSVCVMAPCVSACDSVSVSVRRRYCQRRTALAELRGASPPDTPEPPLRSSAAAARHPDVFAPLVGGANEALGVAVAPQQTNDRGRQLVLGCPCAARGEAPGGQLREFL